MAYNYDGVCRTQKGKVTYTRKPHLWNGKDIDRIVNLLNDPETDYQEYWLLECTIHLLSHLARLYSELPEKEKDSILAYLRRKQFELPEYFAFSGGEFGGAGASRPF